MSLRQISLITGLPADVPQIEDITDDLPRGAESWQDIEGKRHPDSITAIVVHHTASEAPLENQAAYHVNHHKWPGLSYHLIISKGRIYQVNDLLDFTYHVSAHNAYTVAVAIHGDLSKREMTSQERELLYAAILTVKSLLPITEIKGHNELNATACPCTSMNRIREDIKTLEMKMQRQQSMEYRRGRAYDVVNQCNYMYSLIGKGDGDETWALNWFDTFHDFLKSKDMV